MYYSILYICKLLSLKFMVLLIFDLAHDFVRNAQLPKIIKFIPLDLALTLQNTATATIEQKLTTTAPLHTPQGVYLALA